MVDIVCPACGAALEDGRCPKCGWSPPPTIPQLLDGYRIHPTKNGGIVYKIIKKEETDGDEAETSTEQPLFTVTSFGNITAKRIAENLNLEYHLVERQLAELANYLEKTQPATPDTSPNEERTSQAAQIVALVQDTGCKLSKDQYGVPHICYPDLISTNGNNAINSISQVNNNDSTKVYKTYPLQSPIVKDRIAMQFYTETNKIPSSEAINAALSILRAKAREGPTHTLYNRVAPDGQGGTLIDLANDNWEHLHVTSEGWKIEKREDPIFYRYSHQKELPVPIEGGNPWTILGFVNLKNENQQLLYLVSIISFLVPEIQHPNMVIWGPPGSGKSLALKFAREIVDPSTVDLLAMPRNDMEMAQQLNHHYCCFYDNVSVLSNWASDVLCRAVTGAGITKRKLYTDDDDVIYRFRRCVGLNGINIVPQRSDLLDRTIILNCELLPNNLRKEEKELTEQFSADAGLILGGMLDTLVKARNIYLTIQLTELYRLSDFTRWGCAITEALGMDHQRFLDAYEENVKNQNEEILDSSPISRVLVSFMNSFTSEWSGPPSLLYSALCDHAQSLGISIKQKKWPKSPEWMMRRLTEDLPSLLAAGIKVESNHTGTNRVVTITRIRQNSENSVNSVSSVSDGENSAAEKTITAFDDFLNNVSEVSTHTDAETPTSAQLVERIVDWIRKTQGGSTDEELAQTFREVHPRTLENAIKAAARDGLIYKDTRDGRWKIR